MRLPSRVQIYALNRAIMCDDRDAVRRVRDVAKASGVASWLTKKLAKSKKPHMTTANINFTDLRSGGVTENLKI